MQPVESLISYATDKRITALVAKERGKCAAKASGKLERRLRNPVFAKVRSMTPLHSEWCHPGKGRMPKRTDRGLSSWTAGKKRATARILAGMQWGRRKDPDCEWGRELDRFIGSVREALSGTGPLVLETPVTLYKFKKALSDDGPFVYRPICRYNDLLTKVILSLSVNWLLSFADRCFGTHMLFLRTASKQADGTWKVPDFLDAIDRIGAYRKAHDRNRIWVGECDIQKFYDIFNHDDIIRCFEDLFAEVRERTGTPDGAFDPFRRVLKAYLASYSFPREVLGRNGDPGFWKEETARLRNEGHADPVCLFQWVDEDDFVRSGCYSPGEFARVVEEGGIGIPQGGSLSCLIVNVVMRCIDRRILSRKDPDRLFLRYCDDIVLMNTDRERCAADLDTYRQALTEHKLLYHPFRPFSGLKRGRRNRDAFWEAKSKGPYLWGRGAGDASNWVAFLGYEMHRNGEVRIRKDKVAQELRRIKRAYYSALKAKPENRTEEKFVEKFNKVSHHLLDFERISTGRFTLSQAARLDKHLLWNARRAARKIGLPESVTGLIDTYTKVITEKATAVE